MRYRGLAKNATRAFTALALSHIYMSRETGASTRAQSRSRDPLARPIRARKSVSVSATRLECPSARCEGFGIVVIGVVRWTTT
ncbi:protein of unknown function (plasmid) [Caballeronia sp. S22]